MYWYIYYKKMMIKIYGETLKIVFPEESGQRLQFLCHEAITSIHTERNDIEKLSNISLNTNIFNNSELNLLKYFVILYSILSNRLNGAAP
jgi:hypothetical protein